MAGITALLSAGALALGLGVSAVQFQQKKKEASRLKKATKKQEELARDKASKTAVRKNTGAKVKVGTPRAATAAQQAAAGKKAGSTGVGGLAAGKLGL